MIQQSHSWACIWRKQVLSCRKFSHTPFASQKRFLFLRAPMERLLLIKEVRLFLEIISDHETHPPFCYKINLPLPLKKLALFSHLLPLKSSRTLGGSWTQKPLCVPRFLFVGNRLHSASMTFPEFQRAGSNSC